jgi:hypothetical protein
MHLLQTAWSARCDFMQISDPIRVEFFHSNKSVERYREVFRHDQQHDCSRGIWLVACAREPTRFEDVHAYQLHLIELSVQSIAPRMATGAGLTRIRKL